mmetsp:Transcript_496/g.610  ORF Transcript_496/g.610 Transcript_496/m.610 type:complete len:380 (+) Transcript_496:119-1258(+)
MAPKRYFLQIFLLFGGLLGMIPLLTNHAIVPQVARKGILDKPPNETKKNATVMHEESNLTFSSKIVDEAEIKLYNDNSGKNTTGDSDELKTEYNATEMDEESNLSFSSKIANENKIKQHNDDPTKNTTGRVIRIEDLLPDLLNITERYCGGRKCFFKSKSKPLDIGYLINPEISLDERYNVDKGWQLCQQVASQFDIQHFLLEAPWHCEGCARILKLPKLPGIKRENFTESIRDNLVVQKVQIAPPQCIEWKPRARNKPALKIAPWLREYYDDLNNTSIQDSNITSERNITAASFQRMADGFATAEKIINSFPKLSIDFQLYIDESTGQVYHLDFDRPFDNKNFAETQPARRIQARNLRKVLKELETLKQLAESKGMNS